MFQQQRKPTTTNSITLFFIRFLLWIYAWSKYYLGILPEPIKIVSTIQILEKHYKKYLDIFRNQSYDAANENIDEFMYNYNERKEKLTEIGNEWELRWHRRVLIEKYPSELLSIAGGKNIIMFFDPYTNSFQYYSDESTVPYDILNYIAIKYVVTYRCRDFFIDTIMHPNNSMYNEYLKEEDNALSTKRQAKELNGANVFVDSNKKTSAMNSTAFSKVMDKKMDNVKKENQNKTARLYSNSFTRLGKVADFNILQTPPKTKANELLFGDNTLSIHGTMSYFDDKTTESLEITENDVKEINEIKEVPKPSNNGKLSYKDFKRMNMNQEKS
jgi:hypothetical protein